jgi:hypothetical protein
MNDKIKQLLENAEKSDAIARNKWRIENREQLRKERKEKLKELMEKDKQQTAVEWYIIKRDEIEMKIRLMLICANQYEQELTKADEQAKEMEVAGKEMSYSDGYAEGYKRAIELTKWAISNLIPPHNEQNRTT